CRMAPTRLAAASGVSMPSKFTRYPDGVLLTPCTTNVRAPVRGFSIVTFLRPSKRPGTSEYDCTLTSPRNPCTPRTFPIATISDLSLCIPDSMARSYSSSLGFGCGLYLLQQSRPMQEIMHGDRRLRTLLQPCQHPFLLHGDGGRRFQGIIRAQHFKIPAITRHAGIGGHNAVERPFVTAPSCQSKSHHV